MSADLDPHRPANVEQLRHAYRHARSALSALHALDPRALNGEQFQDLSRIAAGLADLVDALAEIVP